jgi:hypothetical protein
VPDGDDLGEDRERGLLQRFPAEVEARGAAQPRELSLRQAFLLESLAPFRLRSP